MDFQLLRSWLGLPPGPWPPDHYALLGVPGGRSDPAGVELRVLERMDLLRPRQLLHPELVTEGMNRLAQALITLTDPAAKAAYDAEIGLPPVPELSRPVASPPKAPRPDAPVVVAAPVFEDVFSDDLRDSGDDPDPGEVTGTLPPPGPDGVIDAEVVEPITAEHQPIAFTGTAAPYEVVAPDEPAPLPLPTWDVEDLPDADVPPEGVAVVVAAPVHTDRRWVYARLALLRKALRAWDRLGPVLGDPQDPVDRPSRVVLLLEAVRGVLPLLPQLRGVVGGIGEPGGVVAAVVSQRLLLDTLRRLLPSQRQAVAIDWRRGQAELAGEYARLRGLTRRDRGRRAGARGLTALARWAKDTPELVLVLLAALAFALAALRGTGGR